MRKPQSLLVISLLLLSFIANAQKVKPVFKSFLYVTYDYDEKTKRADVQTIIDINAAGMLHLQDKWYDGIADTTYRVADTSLIKLNDIFNGSKPLKSYMIADHMAPGMHYGGSFGYIKYADAQGNIYQFTVVGLFMSKDFQDATESLYQSPSKIAYKRKTLNSPILLKQALDTQKKASYAPKIEQPPAVLELKN